MFVPLLLETPKMPLGLYGRTLGVQIYVCMGLAAREHAKYTAVSVGRKLPEFSQRRAVGQLLSVVGNARAIMPVHGVFHPRI
jgi:hypothetical protein